MAVISGWKVIDSVESSGSKVGDAGRGVDLRACLQEFYLLAIVDARALCKNVPDEILGILNLMQGDSGRGCDGTRATALQALALAI